MVGMIEEPSTEQEECPEYGPTFANELKEKLVALFIYISSLVIIINFFVKHYHVCLGLWSIQLYIITGIPHVHQ